LSTITSTPRFETSTRSTAPWLVLVAALATCAAVACKPRGNEVAIPVAPAAEPSAASPVSAREAGRLASSSTEVAVASEPQDPAIEARPLDKKGAAEIPDDVAGALGELARKPRIAEEESEEGEEGEEGKDYWAKIPFDQINFKEVLDYVDTYYIDDHYSVRRSYIEAANFALGTLEPAFELLPDDFYKKRKGHAEEEGRLDGKVEGFKCNDGAKGGVLLHQVPKKKDEKRKRLSDDEILKLRARIKGRHELLEKSWGGVGFGREEFECAMKVASTKLDEMKKKGAPVNAKDKDKAKAKKIDIRKVWINAAQGFLYALDPHSSIVSRDAWEESTRSTQDASFSGIGAVLMQRDEMTLVESPMEGQPAAVAGVRAGDVIVRVDQKEIKGLMLHKVVKRIRGKTGTKVTLTLRREGVPKDFDVTIVRARIDLKNVSGNLVKEHEGIAYVKMTGFVPESTKDMRAKLEELARQAPGGKLRGLVFDLRNNSGGLLQKSIEIADMFLKSGRIVTVRSRQRDKAEEITEATQADDDYDFPIVVLVNDGSASASEIVASAIQDNARGLVLGDRTFGKASVQTLFEPALHREYYIKLTVARYYSPSGRTLQVAGISPDVFVAPTPDGKMPVGFREENLNNHLSPIETSYKSPNEEQAKAAQVCVKEFGKADKMVAVDPHPVIKPDYQLLKAADFVDCLARARTAR